MPGNTIVFCNLNGDPYKSIAGKRKRILFNVSYLSITISTLFILSLLGGPEINVE
jgi:hypothetical protein